MVHHDTSPTNLTLGKKVKGQCHTVKTAKKVIECPASSYLSAGSALFVMENAITVYMCCCCC